LKSNITPVGYMLLGLHCFSTHRR